MCYFQFQIAWFCLRYGRKYKSRQHLKDLKKSNIWFSETCRYPVFVFSSSCSSSSSSGRLTHPPAPRFSFWFHFYLPPLLSLQLFISLLPPPSLYCLYLAHSGFKLLSTDCLCLSPQSSFPSIPPISLLFLLFLFCTFFQKTIWHRGKRVLTEGGGYYFIYTTVLHQSFTVLLRTCTTLIYKLFFA